MSAAAHARSIYRQSARPLRSPRETEYELLATITTRIRAALQHQRNRLSPALVAALHDNLGLWATFGADLADPRNGFPPELRARLFYLAEFTRHHTGRVLSGEATAEILNDINTAVMRGLRGRGPAS